MNLRTLFEWIYKSTFNVRYVVISSKRTSARFRKMFTARVVARNSLIQPLRGAAFSRSTKGFVLCVATWYTYTVRAPRDGSVRGAPLMTGYGRV